MAVRVGLVVLSLLAVGWLSAELRATRAEKQAHAIVFGSPGPLSSTDKRRVSRLLDDAGRLNPDTEPDIDRTWLLSLRYKRPAAARRVLEGVLRREPRNLEAWGVLRLVALGAHDPRGAARARAHLLRLAPPVPEP
jgi:hypothetical protein